MTFERFAGLCGLLLAVGAIVYSVLFITIVEGNENTESWFAVLLGGAIFTVPVMIAVYGRLRAVDEGFALLGFVFGLGGAFGGVLHGGYELGFLVTPPKQGYYPGVEAVSKGVLRYLVAGLALLVIGWLITRSAGRFPVGSGYLAILGGALLVFIYFGRLFDFITAGDYVSLIPPIVYGFVVHPLLYAWIGWTLWRSSSDYSETSARA